MGALNFIRSIFGGNPPRSSNSVQGGTGAVNPPTSYPPSSQRELDKLVDYIDTKGYDVPRFCRSTLKMIARKKGATIAEIVKKTGKSKNTIYQEVALIKKSGVKIVRAYEKPAYRFRVG